MPSQKSARPNGAQATPGPTTRPGLRRQPPRAESRPEASLTLRCIPPPRKEIAAQAPTHRRHPDTTAAECSSRVVPPPQQPATPNHPATETENTAPPHRNLSGNPTAAAGRTMRATHAARTPHSRSFYDAPQASAAGSRSTQRSAAPCVRPPQQHPHRRRYRSPPNPTTRLPEISRSPACARSSTCAAPSSTRKYSNTSSRSNPPLTPAFATAPKEDLRGFFVPLFAHTRNRTSSTRTAIRNATSGRIRLRSGSAELQLLVTKPTNSGLSRTTISGEYPSRKSDSI